MVRNGFGFEDSDNFVASVGLFNENVVQGLELAVLRLEVDDTSGMDDDGVEIS